ncbi:LCP family protein [Candidatus Uhrbacteria bacterium]|nr:LCP family protein [Candidatus Uhrbacteria bacterium]
MRDRLKICFLDKNQEKIAQKTTVLIAAVFTLAVGLMAALGAHASYRASTHGTSVFSEFGNFFSFGNVNNLQNNQNSANPNDPLSTPDGRLNILLLGIGGEGHEGSQLTDTIIFASLDRETNKIGLVSIPRDLAYPLGEGRYQKINAVNAYAEKEFPGEGAKHTAQEFSRQFNIRIDRTIKIDFKGFAAFIDALGGIDVAIENSFTDHTYPTDDDGPDPYKVQTVSFAKGDEHMSGKRALIFVRSRHGNNNEGSDIARGKRQQLILDAIRKKLLSVGTLSNPKKVSEIWASISNHVQTDLGAWDVLKSLPMAAHFSKTNLTMNVLTTGATGQLYAQKTEYAGDLLFPKKADWSEIRSIVADPFSGKDTQLEAIKTEQPINVEVRNGTNKVGFAAQISDKLTDAGYKIVATSNALQHNFEKSVIVDYTNGANPESLAKLKTLLDANVSLSSAEKNITSSTQFLIILGRSSVNLVNN